MDLQALANSSFGIQLATRLPRLLPAGVGRVLSIALADLTASRQDSALVCTVRANQWIVRGGQLTSKELNQIVHRVVRHRTRCVFDLYHAINRPAELERLSPPTVEMERLIERYCGTHGGRISGKPGAILVAPHLSNYDLVMLVNASRGLRAQVLVHPNPAPGYQYHYRIWSSRGLEATPSTPTALEQAVERVKNGGLVITGIDRPVSAKTHVVSFFGRPSPLPVGHIRLALAADVPVIPIAAHMLPDGTYAPRFSSPITMVKIPDHRETVQLNAEAVLAVMEQFISQTPDQWLMFNQVWPDAPEAIRVVGLAQNGAPRSAACMD